MLVDTETTTQNWIIEIVLSQSKRPEVCLTAVTLNTVHIVSPDPLSRNGCAAWATREGENHKFSQGSSWLTLSVGIVSVLSCSQFCHDSWSMRQVGRRTERARSLQKRSSLKVSSACSVFPPQRSSSPRQPFLIVLVYSLDICRMLHSVPGS